MASLACDTSLARSHNERIRLGRRVNYRYRLGIVRVRRDSVVESLGLSFVEEDSIRRDSDDAPLVLVQPSHNRPRIGTALT